MRLSKTWSVSAIFLLLFAVLCALATSLSCSSATPPSTVVLVPVLSPPGGYSDHDIRIEISHPGRGMGVLLTLDSSVPTPTTGTLYAQPIQLSALAPAVTVLRARVVSREGELGPVVSASYLVGVAATLPVLSLIVDPGDLWDTERGIYVNPLERGRAWERPVDVTYLDADRDSGFHVPAGLRIHGGATRSADKKSLRLYFRNEYGLNRLEYPLFDRGTVQSFKRLVLHHGGQDSIHSQANWLLLRNQLVGELALEMGGCAARSRPVLVFLNGQPWGVYLIRERIDRWFLADHYGIQSADLLDTPVINGQDAVLEGDRKHWDDLVHFLETHSLADQDNYAYVQTRVDLANLIDYTVLQVYSANVDWLHTNVNQFRPRVTGGRWSWAFWDSDWSFGLEPHSKVDSNIIRDALNPDHPDTAGVDTLLLRRLLENPHFRNWFLTHTADLLNTMLSPDVVVTHIDTLAAEMAPDIVYETSRWPRPTDHWETSVQALREFARARPEVVRRHVVAAFGLEGMTSLTFEPSSAGMGSVAVNGALVPDLPWQGTYFQGTRVQIVAVPAPGYRFAGWDAADLGQTPVVTLTVDTTRTLSPRFELLPRGAFQPGDVVFAGRQLDGDGSEEWFELEVRRRGGVDLRGWRVTDNDTKWATDEGSLIFAQRPTFARVPRGTTIRIVPVSADGSGTRVPEDDVGVWDQRMVLYAANGNLNTERDPGFAVGVKDNLVLLAPGPTAAFEDDQGIAFASGNMAVTPASFGVLADGVVGGRSVNGRNEMANPARRGAGE